MTYRLEYADDAMRDIEQALAWTKEQFGALQRSKYQKLIFTAAQLLETSPIQSPTRSRDDIAIGVRYLHIAKRGSNARHFFLYTIEPKKKEVHVLRLLHDAMDVERIDI